MNVKNELCQNTKTNETLVGVTLYRKVCEDKGAIIVALGARKISTNCLNNSLNFALKSKWPFGSTDIINVTDDAQAKKKMRSQN